MWASTHYNSVKSASPVQGITVLSSPPPVYPSSLLPCPPVQYSSSLLLSIRTILLRLMSYSGRNTTVPLLFICETLSTDIDSVFFIFKQFFIPSLRYFAISLSCFIFIFFKLGVGVFGVLELFEAFIIGVGVFPDSILLNFSIIELKTCPITLVFGFSCMLVASGRLDGLLLGIFWGVISGKVGGVSEGLLWLLGDGWAGCSIVSFLRFAGGWWMGGWEVGLAAGGGLVGFIVGRWFAGF